VNVCDLSPIKNLNDQFGNGDGVLRADNGRVMHGQPSIIKGINPTAVTCAVSHLNKHPMAQVCVALKVLKH
jgi:hypothetical protein